MLTQKEISYKYLLTLLDYRDGQLFWKAGGARAGYTVKGYREIYFAQQLYVEHHLIFLLFHGRMPLEVDHINLIRDDNRIENLRECTRAQNGYNNSSRSHNKTGVKGVFKDKQSGKFKSAIIVDGRKIHVGYFDNIEAAQVAITIARAKHHGEFARHA